MFFQGGPKKRPRASQERPRVIQKYPESGQDRPQSVPRAGAANKTSKSNINQQIASKKSRPSKHSGSWSGSVLRKTQEGKDLKNNDFGTNFGAHFFSCPSCVFRPALFLEGLKHKKGRISIRMPIPKQSVSCERCKDFWILNDVGWRKTQEGQDFQAIFPEVEWSKTQEGEEFWDK